MENNLTYEKRVSFFSNNSGIEIFGEKQSLTGRLFGCWHLKMSSPRTIRDTTFRYCKNCGMRRKFDLKSLKYEGTFHNSPVN
jgi:hypothetical protein